jgi:hypothetical protein
MTWHYTFGKAQAKMADFCGFQHLNRAPTVEDGLEVLDAARQSIDARIRLWDESAHRRRLATIFNCA